MNMAAVVMALVGLFLAPILWRISRRQALRHPLFAMGDGPVTAWLPLWGFGRSPLDAETGEPRNKYQAAFEVGTALYFAGLGHRFGFSLDLLMILCFSIPLLVIMLVDFWTRLIHTNVILVGISLGWLFAAIEGGGELIDSLIGMLIGAGVFFFFYFLAIVIYRNPKVVPFGLGDVYLAAMIGAMVRVDQIARALVLGMLLAAIILGALLVARVLSRRQAVAYGPYLCLGALLTLFLM
jgi:leader peptidase (prepilin peptidase)/N-methyltransferase